MKRCIIYARIGGPASEVNNSLILDDFLLHTITDEREVKVLFEILEKRCEINLSTIICSQQEPASWSSMILNDEVSANAILKRATKHYTVVIKPNITD